MYEEQTNAIMRACSADGTAALRLRRARCTGGSQHANLPRNSAAFHSRANRRAGNPDAKRNAGDDSSARTNSDADTRPLPHAKESADVFQLCRFDLV